METTATHWPAQLVTMVIIESVQIFFGTKSFALGHYETSPSAPRVSKDLTCPNLFSKAFFEDCILYKFQYTVRNTSI